MQPISTPILIPGQGRLVIPHTEPSVRFLPSIRNFKGVMERYDSFAQSFNAIVREQRHQGDKTAQTLKSTHRSLFQDIVNQIMGQLRKVRSTFRDNPDLTQLDASQPFILSTNLVRTMKRTGKNKATVFRNLNRLIRAGVIMEKVNHGTRANFELYINPSFLLITDDLRTSPDASTAPPLYANCNPIERHKNFVIDTIIPVNDVENSNMKGVCCADLLNETQTNIYTNTGELGEIDADTKAHSPKKGNSGEESHAQNELRPSLQSESLQNQRKLHANWFIAYMIKTLFPNHKHYPNALENAREYAARVYLAECRTNKDFERAMACLLWRVDAAKRWSQRTGFSFENIYITAYLDVENKRSGFTNTQRWWKEHRQRQRRKEALHRRKTDLQKLQIQLRKLHENLSVHTYFQAEQYVQKNIPHLLEQFYKATESIRYCTTKIA